MTMGILYPEPLVQGRVIGVTATSSGVEAPSHIQRLELIEAQLRAEGYEVIEGKCLRGDHKHVSGSAAERAADFTVLWNDPQVAVVFPPWGGELLIPILTHLDFEALARHPKWVMGYSDTSTLLFALTVTAGIATAHGYGLLDLVRDQECGAWDTAFGVLGTGGGFEFTQTSFERHQVTYIPYEERVDAKFNLTEPSAWKRLGCAEPCALSGRLIGGCLDTVVHLVGTPYGDLPAFIERHVADGVILFLENCELTPCQVARSLWQMRLAGWFEGLSGMMFGRSAARDVNDPESLSYVEAVASVVGDLSIPVLYDADFGHRPPQMILVNGAVASVEWRDGKAVVTQRFI
ncbi:LD-carboxypeptidase [Luteolibacter ambystomatis]|uniref:LD-carboxypeptidase n=1 Tax=Luteolibacter ambystomatis TaxID=2824561 RepID=A0A975J0A0_9BACT|nr:S66 peptidase family protein [Luteolibacter ambystomatis]QUE51651.1 LD-carboxypeptidase [Luteolibacter ambystomatis]